MNKSELVDAIAAATEGATKKDIDIILSAAVTAIQEAVAAGDKVTLVGFGSFERKERAARIGRNPKTGAELEIPAAKVPAFSAGKSFKDKVAA